MSRTQMEMKRHSYRAADALPHFRSPEAGRREREILKPQGNSANTHGSLPFSLSAFFSVSFSCKSQSCCFSSSVCKPASLSSTGKGCRALLCFWVFKKRIFPVWSCWRTTDSLILRWAKYVNIPDLGGGGRISMQMSHLAICHKNMTTVNPRGIP